MVVDLRGTGPYEGLSSYVALVPTMTDFCTVIKGCSVFLLFFLRSTKWRTHSNLVVRADQAFFHQAGRRAGRQ